MDLVWSVGLLWACVGPDMGLLVTQTGMSRGCFNAAIYCKGPAMGKNGPIYEFALGL